MYLAAVLLLGLGCVALLYSWKAIEQMPEPRFGEILGLIR